MRKGKRHGILDQSQPGCQAARSTTDMVVCALHTIASRDEGKYGDPGSSSRLLRPSLAAYSLTW